jgi:endonuclease/exonuclease/phosphatase family metal-dependent hydrolase
MFRMMAIWLAFALAARAAPLRVATYNIETHRDEDSGFPDFALGEPGTIHHDSVAAVLGRIDADVVALQEVHTSDLSGEPASPVDQLAATLGLPHVFAATNSGAFDTNLRVVFLSRHPFLTNESIISPPGAREISRHSPAVVVDVPATDADPLLISAHLKAGTRGADRFRRAIEMRRLTKHLADSGFAETDNFIVLGDFNPSGDPRTFSEPPGGMPVTYELGADMPFPVEYSPGMISYFSDPLPVRLDPRQLNGSDGTFIFGRRIDLIFVSPAIAARALATEVYRSDFDTANEQGLPKAGAPLNSNVSFDASDHYAVFADLELEGVLPSLDLTVAPSVVAETAPEGTAALTTTLPQPATEAVTIGLSSDHPGAVPADDEVIVAAGEVTAEIAVATRRNFRHGADRPVTFTASADGFASATTVLALADGDTAYAFAAPGGTVTENFDGFAGSGDPAPWATDAAAWLGTDAGGSPESGARAYGENGEVAPGFLAADGPRVLETAVENAAGITLRTLDLTWSAEQWRAVAGGGEDRIEVEIEHDGAVTPMPGFRARTDLPDGPVAGGASVRLSGRAGGLAVPDGDSFTLRFRYVPAPGSAPLPDDVFVNEFHYDNDGADTGEFVEIAVGPGFGGALEDVELVLYNGRNGEVYGTHGLESFNVGEVTDSGHRLFSKMIGGIQNGAPDGLALVVGGEVRSLLSYEGAFTAADGPAAGMDSTDIGVSQTSVPTGAGALGLTGTGVVAADFVWSAQDGIPHGPGEVNAGQSFALEGRPPQGLAVDDVALTFVEDADGDGLTDDEEARFGSDPWDAGSRFEPRVVTAENGARALRFPAADGVTYQLEWSTDLSEWNPLPDVVGAGVIEEIALPEASGRMFARVRVAD